MEAKLVSSNSRVLDFVHQKCLVSDHCYVILRMLYYIYTILHYCELDRPLKLTKIRFESPTNSEPAVPNT